MRVILSVLLTLVAAAGGAAEVYMAIAPDGTVIYSDRPTAPDAKPIGVNVVSSSRAQSAAPAAEPQNPATASADARRDAASEAAELRASAAERARNCEIARERSTQYANARRLYREAADGEREYLNDAEIDEVRAEAAADVELWCS